MGCPCHWGHCRRRAAYACVWLAMSSSSSYPRVPSGPSSSRHQALRRRVMSDMVGCQHSTLYGACVRCGEVPVIWGLGYAKRRYLCHLGGLVMQNGHVGVIWCGILGNGGVCVV